jgi:hypothetical protein
MAKKTHNNHNKVLLMKNEMKKAKGGVTLPIGARYREIIVA